MYDVLIIGGGVIGCAIARELSAYKLNILVLESQNDIAMGTTKANSGIVHAGYDAIPGSVKAEMNLKGNPMFDKLSKDLDFPFKRNGSLVLCFDEKDRPTLDELYKRGIENKVEKLEILEKDELLKREPNLSKDVVAALYAPTGGIVSPYEMNIAYAENACENGVEILCNQKVKGIQQNSDTFVVKTKNCSFESKILINTAGVYADYINNLISNNKIEIIPRAGEYLLLDWTIEGYVNSTIFQLPTPMGKGILVAPTVEGTILLGPTAIDLADKEDVSTNKDNIEKILNLAEKSLDKVPTSEIITSFTGIRAHNPDGDFIIDFVKDVPGMINVAGIESPGLTAAPAIAERVVELVGRKITLENNEDFSPIRKGIVTFWKESYQSKQWLIEGNPQYGKVVCQCETVTEAQILASINRPVGATDIDGVKRRTRAGMGRCQGGFCSPLVLGILSDELGLSPTEITKMGKGSEVLVSKVKHLGGDHDES